MKVKLTRFLLFIFCLSVFQIQAQQIYKTNWKQEASILGTSSGLFLGGYLIEKNRDSISIEALNNLSKNNINAFDRSTVSNFSDSAAKTSDLFKKGSIIIPFSLFLSKQARENFNPIVLMYIEVMAVNNGMTSMTKAAFGRYRPYAYNPDVPLDFKITATTRRSFYSGHVSEVASLSFFTASVFSDLYPESNYKYLIWTGAIAAPAMTAYLRYKAGRHFPTDVIVGYGMGALVGYIIPKLHKMNTMPDVSIIGIENGLGIVYQF